MGFFSGLLTAFGQFGATLALDAVSALLNGPAPTVAKDLKDKSFTSRAYGTPWPRCRGTVRLPGKVIYASPIRTSIWKTTGGGFLGIGQKSVYYNKYSASIFIGFGKKVNLGIASKILRIWADGKLLFDALSSDATITGTVTASVITAGQAPGSQVLLVDLASGATLKLNPGDLIQIPGDPNFGYEVQEPVNVSGPQTRYPISIWPPLRVNIAGGGQLTIAGLNQSPWDLSSFDPNPHDGSHPNGGYLCPPGGVTFYLGDPAQQPDPTMVKALGTGNVPGYTNLVGIMIHDLQLVNYGNRIPQFSAEIAFDPANGQYPAITIASVNLAGNGNDDYFATAFSGNEAVQWSDPTSRLPYAWAESGYDKKTIYRVNLLTNQMEATFVSAAYISSAPKICVDLDGYIYYVQNDTTLTKVDGKTMQQLNTATLGFTVATQGICAFDTQQSLFGNPVVIKLLVVGVNIYDRKLLLPLGTPNPAALNFIVYGYDKSGNPLTALGDAFDSGLAAGGFVPSGFGMTDDIHGNLWIWWNAWGANPYLYKMPMQFASSFDLTTGTEYLSLPSFATTSVNVPAAGNGYVATLYSPADDTIVLIGNSNLIKIDQNLNIVKTVSLAFASQSFSISYDPMGTVVISDNSIANGFIRIDLANLTTLDTYNFSNFVAVGVTIPPGNTPMYDPLTDSVLFNAGTNVAPYGGLNRAYIDRANGAGIGLDSIVSSLMQEAGYSTSEFDVTMLTAAGTTVYGVEFERETFIDSLKHLMEVYLFDAAEIDGKIKFVPRGQAPSVIPATGSNTIPESDLGALQSPDKYEPRADEPVEDPLDVPESVCIKYYDPLRQGQQAAQYAKRISKPYASTLASGKNVTNSRQRRDITVPITENAQPVQNQAAKILWDLWTGRFQRKFKLPYKYLQLDPTDVVLLNYKGANLETRIEEADFGAGLALDIIGRSQDETVYSSTSLPAASIGLGSGTPVSQPPIDNTNYTLSPPTPLSSPNSTTIDMAAFTAAFASGSRTSYAARTFTVADPGAGNTQVYYVTIADPNYTGDQPPGTASLTALCNTTPAASHVGEAGYIYAGAIVVAGSGASGGGPVGSGGQPEPNSGVLVGEVSFTSTRGNFQVAHGLGQIPSNVQIQLTGDGEVVFQVLRYDATYVYLVGSADGITGYLELFQ